MAEAADDVSKGEIDKSEETVEGDANLESSTTDEAAVDVSAGGDAGDDDVKVNESAAADSTDVVEESDTVETVVVSADTAAEPTVASDVIADDDDGNDVAVVISEADNSESSEMAEQPAADVNVETEADKAVAEVEPDVTTDRVEHVTSKADKVTVPVELSETDEVSEGTVVTTEVPVEVTVTKSEASDTAAAVTKSEAADAGTVNKTTHDVITMAGNDELKFGVLIGLVRVGQLSNKDVVDSVLCLVSTGTL